MHWNFTVLIFLIPGLLAGMILNMHNNRHENLIKGLEVISNEVLTEHVSILNIIPTFSGYNFIDFCDSFIKLLMEKINFKVRQEHVDKIGESHLQAPRKFSMVIIETYKDFQKILKTMSNKYFQTHGHYIVTLINGTIPEISSIFSEFWKRDFYNVIIVYEDGIGNVPVVTFLPFRSSTDCSNTSPVLINTFINESFIHGLQNIFINKMQNLHQCKVRVATSDSSEPHIALQRMPNGYEFIYGRDYDLLVALSQGLNFKLTFSYIGLLGYIYPNGTAKGSLEKVLNKEADLSIGDWWLRLYRLDYYDATTSYISERLMFVVPYGNDLTSIEKLLYPLSLTSWLVLNAFVLCGFFIIFVINRMSKRTQNFIIGEKVNYPYLNMIIALLGQQQHPLPKRNFARFLLMSFLLLSLVMRTAYQGKMFQLMKLNMKHPEADSVNDLIDQGYEVLLPDIFIDYIEWRSLKYRAWPFGQDNLSSETMLPKVVKKTALLGSYTDLMYNMQNMTSLKAKLLHKEILITFPVVIYTRKDFHLLWAFNEKIEILRAAGLITFWYRKSLNIKTNSREKEQPKQLSFEELSGCFQILGFGCLVSSIVFISQLMYYKIRKFRRIY